MAEGLGFKTFTTGEVLTAADVNGYLMQGILVFASEAARNSAITSPQEGQFAFTKDTNSLWYYTGSAWAASGAAGDIEGVTAGVGISGGGTSGTVTITNSMATAIDAKGDLVVGTGADTFNRLAVGSNNQVLTADSTTATGLKWAAASTGKIAQLVTDATATEVTSTTSTWIDSGLNITITPTASTSTLIFWFSSFSRKSAGNADNYVELKLALTTGGDIAEYGYNFQEGESSDFAATIAGVAYTSAGSTSARTYRLYLRSQGGSGASSSIAADGKGGYIMCMEVLA